MSAQTPEAQDCLGAIPICQEEYLEPDPYEYSGQGGYEDEIAKLQDCYTDEDNGLWYIFTAQSDGVLRFTLTPNQSEDDYDWIAFDMTNTHCGQLASNPQPYMISTNNYGSYDDNGPTGADSQESGGNAGNCNGPGEANGPPWNDDIPVTQGNTYLLYISNWSGSTYGYHIDFSRSTAQIYDNMNPQLSGIANTPIMPGNRHIEVRLSERVSCEFIQNNSLTLYRGNQRVAVDSIVGPTCSQGGAWERYLDVYTTNGLTPGSYQLHVGNQLKDACGNTSEPGYLPFEVNDITLQQLAATEPTCHESADASLVITAEYAQGEELLYSIDGGDNFYSNQGIFSNLPAGTYHIVVQNAYGYSRDFGPYTIQAPPPINVSAQHQPTGPCPGDTNGTIQVQATGGTGSLQFSIDGGRQFQSQGTFTGLAKGQYQVLIRDANGCETTTGALQIDGPDSLQIKPRAQDVACFGQANGRIDPDIEGGTPPYQLVLNHLKTPGDNLAPGQYTLQVQDDRGCLSSIINFTIQEPEPLEIRIVNQHNATAYTESGSILLSANGGNGNFRFQLNEYPPTSDSLFTDLPQGNYRLVVSDAKGCGDTTYTTIQSIPELFIPNVITPNGDGINDYWQIDNLMEYRPVEVFVFDKRRTQVYYVKNQPARWDGRDYRGDIRMDGYMYTIRLMGGEVILKGTIAVIK